MTYAIGGYRPLVAQPEVEDCEEQVSPLHKWFYEYSDRFDILSEKIPVSLEGIGWSERFGEFFRGMDAALTSLEMSDPKPFYAMRALLLGFYSEIRNERTHLTEKIAEYKIAHQDPDSSLEHRLLYVKACTGFVYEAYHLLHNCEMDLRKLVPTLEQDQGESSVSSWHYTFGARFDLLREQLQPGTLALLLDCVDRSASLYVQSAHLPTSYSAFLGQLALPWQMLYSCYGNERLSLRVQNGTPLEGQEERQKTLALICEITQFLQALQGSEAQAMSPGALYYQFSCKLNALFCENSEQAFGELRIKQQIVSYKTLHKQCAQELSSVRLSTEEPNATFIKDKSNLLKRELERLERQYDGWLREFKTLISLTDRSVLYWTKKAEQYSTAEVRPSLAATIPSHLNTFFLPLNEELKKAQGLLLYVGGVINAIKRTDATVPNLFGEGMLPNSPKIIAFYNIYADMLSHHVIYFNKFIAIIHEAKAIVADCSVHMGELEANDANNNQKD